MIPVSERLTARSLLPFILATILVPGVVRAAEAADPNSPRVVRLVIEPSRLDPTQKSLSLMPKAEELAEGNAATFYLRAAQALPADLDMDPVWDWRNTPLRDLPQDQVQTVLEQVKTSLDLMGQGARCKTCVWPRFDDDRSPPGIVQYRQLACLLCVKARLEISQGRHEQALDTMRTSLAASKHIGEAPSLVQGIVGAAMASLVFLPVEDLAQAEGAPNLHAAIHALPRPLVDVNVSISSDSPPWIVRMTIKRAMEESHEKVRVLMRRLDTDVAVLECIEALRHFAAGHEGRLPAQLSEIADVQVPNDPATGKPFAYRLEGSKAVLETSIPKGGTPRNSTHYEISVAR